MSIGSRSGNALAAYDIAMARQDLEGLLIHLPDGDLAYFTEGGEHCDDNIEAVTWEQESAMRNRREMAKQVLGKTGDTCGRSRSLANR